MTTQDDVGPHDNKGQDTQNVRVVDCVYTIGGLTALLEQHITTLGAIQNLMMPLPMMTSVFFNHPSCAATVSISPTFTQSQIATNSGMHPFPAGAASHVLSDYTCACLFAPWSNPLTYAISTFPTSTSKYITTTPRS